MHINTRPIPHERLVAISTPIKPSRLQASTVQMFKRRLRSQGKTIRQWSEENNFPAEAVYRVLNGVDKANFGRAHDIAVRAGIKSPEPLAA